eukprot:CAMPEP_0197411766 /NCGR_PEP_ID=MMETSP1165-20131217/32128_1 /TAXON_ID=284809 /ORGANISM="Chrysocystis fragilis, Strain CCMP3189" /LENGTH=63 /DNA_ID=CAMNT_0042938285 /DNA_START=1517 /DNA_END=1705 /DNA_ORIENTATION=-
MTASVLPVAQKSTSVSEVVARESPPPGLHVITPNIRLMSPSPTCVAAWSAPPPTSLSLIHDGE